MKKFTFDLMAKIALLIAALACGFGVSAESYTVDIDDISRVKVQFISSETFESVDAEGFVSGINVVELDGKTSGIQFSATDGNEISNVQYTAPKIGLNDPVYAYPKNGLYTIWASTVDWDGAEIKVSSNKNTTFSATINAQNPFLVYFQNSERDIVDIKPGANTISFSGKNNPFYISVSSSAIEFSVKQNGEPAEKLSNELAIITLADGDVVDIFADVAESLKIQPDPNTLISELPSSVFTMPFNRISTAFNPEETIDAEGVARNIYFDTTGSNEIYLNSPATFFDTDTYLKGVNYNGVVPIRLPQLIYDNGDTKYWAYLLESNIDGYSINPNSDQTIYLINDGENWKCEANIDGDYILGYCTGDGKWTGYGDKALLYSPIRDELNIPQRGSVYNNYKLSPADADITATRSSSGDVYVKGLFTDNADAAIKGKLDNGIVTFPTHQYLGVYEGWHIYFLATDCNGGYCESLKMTYDIENDTYTAEDGAGYAIVAGNMYAKPIYTLQGISFKSASSGIADMTVEYESEYTDILGRKVKQPAKGNLYIKQTKTPDGKVNSTKVIF